MSGGYRGFLGDYLPKDSSGYSDEELRPNGESARKPTLEGFVRRCELDCIGDPVPELSRMVDKVTVCPDCDGEGYWRITKPRRTHEADGILGKEYTEACPYCGGTGKIHR